MKFKVGDKVRIREDLLPFNHYGRFDFSREMWMLIGKEVEILAVADDFYRIKEDGRKYYWSDEMIEGSAEIDKEDSKPQFVDNGDFSDKHYNFNYELTKNDIKNGNIRLDPYFITRQWQLNSKDNTGILFHTLKTIARFGDKNSIEREIKALNSQVKRLAELNGVEL